MTKSLIKKALQLGGVTISRYDKAHQKYNELFRKYHAYTMIPKNYFLLNLELCHAFRNIEGTYIECGVWRGGMSAAIAELLGSKRSVYLFDSFEGLPPAKDIDGKEAQAWQRNTASPEYHDNCKAEEGFTHEAMKLSRHSNYHVYKGWFENTLSQYSHGPIGILRLDGDWYDSIKVCMDQLFPMVSPGGIVILDDYYAWDGCAKAVHDYLSTSHSPSRIYQWQNTLGYIVKKSS